MQKFKIKYQKFKTHEVKVGKITVGGNSRVKTQSMTNTKTSDVESTVNQCKLIFDSGADLVRITVPTVIDTDFLKSINNNLKNNGYPNPIIADIHFSPKAAEISAQIVEKVRINPGNYTDSKKFKDINLSDDDYQKEISKIKKQLIPLINICKKNNTAIRLGANHGSLSDRILSKYGDTPKGMVESVMEFLRICISENFFSIIISMKASNPIVMIHATRLLVKQMIDEGMNFPLHLGVTEAGSDDEGRIKSSIGIGSLLADGIGDTVRVSLTEEPEKELPVAKQIVNIFNPETLSKFSPPENIKVSSKSFFEFNKRLSSPVINIGGENPPVVIAEYSNQQIAELEISNVFLKNKEQSTVPDYIFIGNNSISKTILKNTNYIIDVNFWNNGKNSYPLFKIKDYFSSKIKSNRINFVECSLNEIINDTDFENIKNDKTVVLVANISDRNNKIYEARAFMFFLEQNSVKNPIIFKYKYIEKGEKLIVKSSAETGALFIDGYGDGLWINSQNEATEETTKLSFGILQACRARITQTEYISCPSCGRTLFDLQTTTKKIKEKTAGFKGLKIGIMGCIVNGPGEMADADFGYVGTSAGKITLYKNKEIVKKNIPEKDAVDELLKLIKSQEKK